MAFRDDMTKQPLIEDFIRERGDKIHFDLEGSLCAPDLEYILDVMETEDYETRSFILHVPVGDKTEIFVIKRSPTIEDIDTILERVIQAKL